MYRCRLENPTFFFGKKVRLKGEEHTGKGGNLIDILKLPPALAVEAGPEIGDEDLGAFEEAHGLALEANVVVEAGQLIGQKIDQRCGGSVGRRDAVGETAFVFL